jgi:hypothetical protein
MFTAAKGGDWDEVRRIADSAALNDLIAAVKIRDADEEGNSLVHFLASSGPLDLITRLVDASTETLLTRNRVQQTPLVRALLRTDPDGDAIVKLLLARGAAKSIFVAGYTPDLLVVSLPMARKPTSSAVDLPKPAGVSTEHLAAVDAALASHVALLDLRFSNTLVPDNTILTLGSSDRPSLPLPAPTPSASPPPPPPAGGRPVAFDAFPTGGLAIGDIVEVSTT